MELLNDVHAWLSALPALAVYGLLFVIAYGENVLPPIPGDVAVVVGGMVAAAGVVSLPLVVVLATIGGGLGFMTVYAAGRRLGEAALDPARLRFLPKAELHRARDVVGRRGLVVVAVNRFLPGLRSVIGLAVGMSLMRPLPVAVLATLSAGVWSALIAYLGYALVDNRATLARFLSGFERVGLVLVGVAALALGTWFVRRRRKRAGAGTRDGNGEAG